MNDALAEIAEAQKKKIAEVFTPPKNNVKSVLVEFTNDEASWCYITIHYDGLHCCPTVKQLMAVSSVLGCNLSLVALEKEFDKIKIVLRVE
jgi:hypothetical protein